MAGCGQMELKIVDEGLTFGWIRVGKVDLISFTVDLRVMMVRKPIFDDIQNS